MLVVHVLPVSDGNETAAHFLIPQNLVGRNIKIQLKLHPPLWETVCVSQSGGGRPPAGGKLI